MNFCKKCGNKATAGIRFCQKCGAALEQSTAGGHSGAALNSGSVTNYSSTSSGSIMRLIGNLIWFIFGGFIMALGWFIAGIIWCITIIGIPIGLQAFKLAGLSIWPFGKEVEYGGGAGRFILNIIWIIFGGFLLMLGHLLSGILFSITIIGIPFGIQHFKLAKLALMPFGATIKEI